MASSSNSTCAVVILLALCVAVFGAYRTHGEEPDVRTALMFGDWTLVGVAQVPQETTFPDSPIRDTLGASNESWEPFQPAIRFDADADAVELWFNLPGSGDLTDASLQGLSKYAKLEALILESQHVTDATCILLQRLPNLKRLAIRNANITDLGLKSLATLPRLEVLELADCAAITDVGLEHLRHLPMLRSLDVSGTSITDSGIQVLGQCRSLRELNIGCTRVTVNGLEALPQGIEWLWLQGTPLTGAGCAHLGTLHGLRVLVLQNAGLTDTMLEHLSSLESLNDLVLDGNEVTADGLKALYKLRQLRFLGLRDTSIASPDEARVFERQMPHVVVTGLVGSMGGFEGFARYATAWFSSPSHIASPPCDRPMDSAIACSAPATDTRAKESPERAEGTLKHGAITHFSQRLPIPLHHRVRKAFCLPDSFGTVYYHVKHDCKACAASLSTGDTLTRIDKTKSTALGSFGWDYEIYSAVATTANTGENRPKQTDAPEVPCVVSMHSQVIGIIQLGPKISRLTMTPFALVDIETGQTNGQLGRGN